jgi:Flp pilus assembly protein CpaB
MNFQRILLLLVVLLAAGLAGAFYMNWKTLGQLRTVKAFVEGSVFADAVAACEKAPSTTPFRWTVVTARPDLSPL